MPNIRSSMNRTKTFSPSTSISTISKLMQGTANHIEHEEDTPEINLTDNLQSSEFASKKWVWIPDDKVAFIKGFVVSENDEDGKLRIRCVDDSVCI